MSETPTANWSADSVVRTDSSHSANLAPFVPLRLRRELSGEIVEIATPSAVVGRHTQADLRLNDPDISRRHCRIGLEDGMWRVFDLESTNGVYLNGIRLAGRPLSRRPAARRRDRVRRRTGDAAAQHSRQASPRRDDREHRAGGIAVTFLVAELVRVQDGNMVPL